MTADSRRSAASPRAPVLRISSTASTAGRRLGRFLPAPIAQRRGRRPRVRLSLSLVPVWPNLCENGGSSGSCNLGAAAGVWVRAHERACNGLNVVVQVPAAHVCRSRARRAQDLHPPFLMRVYVRTFVRAYVVVCARELYRQPTHKSFFVHQSYK